MVLVNKHRNETQSGFTKQLEQVEKVLLIFAKNSNTVSK